MFPSSNPFRSFLGIYAIIADDCEIIINNQQSPARRYGFNALATTEILLLNL